MKKVICAILACVFAMTSLLISASAAEADKTPVETLPAVYNESAAKGMIGNTNFGPKYTITAADGGGVKVEGAGDRGTYERVEARGLWTLDGLRVEMKDVATKSSLMLCLVSDVGGFPNGDGGLGIGLDPASNKLWVAGQVANTQVTENDYSCTAGWGTDTAPGAYKTKASTYSVQFNRTLRDIWIVTIDDCASYEVPAELLDAVLDENGQTMLSFVSNADSTVTDKSVSYTITKFVEYADAVSLPDLRTSFVPSFRLAEGEGELFSDPAKNTSVDKGHIFNNTFGGSYELTNREDNGGVDVYVWDDRSEYERLNFGGLWNMDGFRIEFKNVESASPIMLGLVNSYGHFITAGDGDYSAFAIGYENDSLRITGSAENVYNEDTTDEIKNKELVKPVRKSGEVGAYWKEKSDYTLQFNKLENGKWLVTVDDCIQYEFDESKLGADVNMESTALILTANPKNTEVKFTIASIQTGVAAPVVEGDITTDGGNNTDTDKTTDADDGNTTTSTSNASTSAPDTGVVFPVLALAAVMTSSAVLAVSKKRSTH